MTFIKAIVGCACGGSWFFGALKHREKYKEVSSEEPLPVPRFILRNLLSLITCSPWLYWGLLESTSFDISSLFSLSFILYIIGQCIFWSAKICMNTKIITENIEDETTTTDENVKYGMIKNGPYRFVRHPGYSGWIISCISTMLFTQNFLSFIAIIIPCLIIPHYMPKEEEMMKQEYDKKWVKYCKETKYRLFPFLY